MGSERKSENEVQFIKNHQQSGHQKFSDTVLGDYEKLKVPMIAVNPMEEAAGGVKVLSEIIGNDDNFQNDTK